MIGKGLTRAQSNKLYKEALASGDTEALRTLCRKDLFFLLTIACKRKDINHDWLYDRIREFELEPYGHLDLWAREHYKSTIITFGANIQEILNDPEVTIGIFSHTRPNAKDFLDQIKRELESNEFLKDLFPDVLYQNPERDAPKWSLDSGIICKRKSNPKDATVEAWGVVEGQPTGKHFRILNYDDLVTLKNVTNSEQIAKTLTAFELSLNLGARGGKKRYIGTRYHKNDTYSTMLERGTAIPRIHAATEDGKENGKAVFLPEKELAEKRRDMGPYSFASQMLLNPVANNEMGFKEEWLRFYDKLGDISKWNLYLTVDPASGKKKKEAKNDFTVFEVNGFAPDGNVYLIDAFRDRLNLTQRTEKVFHFAHEYDLKGIGYEEYGMQADIEHIEEEMERRNYRFDITPLGGNLSKEDRILKLVPTFEQGRYYMPKTLYFVDSEKRSRDYVKEFLTDEYHDFPVSKHDDMFDCKARIRDPKLDAKFPKIAKKKGPSGGPPNLSGSWMG